MNRELVELSNSITGAAKEDVRNKVINIIRSSNCTISDFAEEVGIPNGELSAFLNGHTGQMSLSTFIRLLTASGHTIEVKSLDEMQSDMASARGSELPIRHHSDIGHHPMNEPPRFDPQFSREIPRQVERPVPTRFGGVRTPESDAIQRARQSAFEAAERARQAQAEEDAEGIDDEDYGDEGIDMGQIVQPRRPNGQFANWPRQAPRQGAAPNFRAMTRNRLVEIIENKVWDGEIDTRTATQEQLAAFLEEKDRKIQAVRRNRQIEQDPNVSRVKRSIEEMLRQNPAAADYIKSFVGSM